MTIIHENRLDAWARQDARIAQGVIVELVFRLVAASCPQPRERRFPLGDSIDQRGADGYLVSDVPYSPLVPPGKSYWEIGTGNNPRQKATDDYRKLTKEVKESERLQSAFIFVTPLSGRTGWSADEGKRGQRAWLERRRKQKNWHRVEIIDGTKLIDWIHQFPSVERWLAEKMGIASSHVESPGERWELIRSFGDPIPLTPKLFLASRSAAIEPLKEVFVGNRVRLKLVSRITDQAVSFVVAWMASNEPDERIEMEGRCIILHSPDSRDVIHALVNRHVLLLDFPVSDIDNSVMVLLQEAKNKGHAVIFGGEPGGIPDPSRISLTNPKEYDISTALEEAGFSKERSRLLSERCGRNLTYLLKLMQNLSTTPEWAQTGQAAELAVAQLIGGWVEDSESDETVIKEISGKEFGEWMKAMREVSISSSAPLISHDRKWKLTSRYEAWYALGPRLTDRDLDRFLECAVRVLREEDPKFELAPGERHTASIHGKSLKHSDLMRDGMAESLALLGSHPDALTNCSSGKAHTISVLAVRETLKDADWKLWASLDRLLPLLAEAAPDEFMDAVETSLVLSPSPWQLVFAQESSGVFGENYLSGLLWALETLAWSPDYLIRATILLGRLAAIDPGGNWANRPANSLVSIFRAWFPQTIAVSEKRFVAVRTIQREFPEVGWRLYLALLAGVHEVAMGSRKPVWRDFLPDDWSEEVTETEYLEQVIHYANEIVGIARNDTSKLIELMDHLSSLPKPAFEELLEHLNSTLLNFNSDDARVELWTKLVNLVTQHRKYPDADWTLPAELLGDLEQVANRLMPKEARYRHRRLFTERDYELMEERGDYREELSKLEKRRVTAVSEIYAESGREGVLRFASEVESPWRVGLAFGAIASKEDEQAIFLNMLGGDDEMSQFVGGLIKGSFSSKGWEWVDSLNTTGWDPSEIGKFLAYLPFTPETWERVSRILGNEEFHYWSETSANPYEAKDGLDFAATKLLEHKRAIAAVKCIETNFSTKEKFDPALGVQVLDAVMSTNQDLRRLDSFAVIEIIKALQNHPETNQDDLFRIEWQYLKLLDRFHGASPRLLEQRLANDPMFFCEVIRLAFKPRHRENECEELTEEKVSIARNAYHLLSEWRTPPGSRTDGLFDGDHLLSWVETAEKACKESDRLEIALQRIGHVLAYAPVDPSGLWIHRSVAAVLDAEDFGEVRRGFQIQLFNSRGVHSHSGGREERILAEGYRTKAEAVENEGFHRLANSLRQMAEDYERDADRQAKRDEFET